MNAENQVLLDAIQQIAAGVQRLDTRMDQRRVTALEQARETP